MGQLKFELSSEILIIKYKPLTFFEFIYIEAFRVFCVKKNDLTSYNHFIKNGRHNRYNTIVSNVKNEVIFFRLFCTYNKMDNFDSHY